ncbi:MAG: ABC transporter substrate-binding protein [bacterium]|nr:ABC transporter substrate-binding protein [bacterium]
MQHLKLVRRLTMVALSLLVLAGTATAQEHAGKTLVVTSYGGTWEQFLRDEILPDFEAATGATVELAVGLSRDWMANLRAAGRGNPPYDVVIANETWISSGRLENRFVSLPEASIPNLALVNPALRLADDIGVLGLLNPLGIAYRTDLVTTPPTSWMDLWSDEYKGNVGIYNISNSAAPMFIMMLALINNGDPKEYGVAFDLIKELAPFKQTDFSGDMENLLVQGEVHVAILDSPAAARLQQQGIPIAFVIPTEGMFMFEQNVNVTAGSQVEDLAFAFVDYMLSTDIQSKWAASYYVTPANVEVTFDSDLARLIPVTADRVGEIKQWDWLWFNQGPREDMVNRWNREIRGN